MGEIVRTKARGSDGLRVAPLPVGVVLLILAAGCQTLRSPREDLAAVRLKNFEGYVEFVSRQRQREQVSKVRADRSRFDETVIEENLGLATEGFLFHPNLLEFSLGGLFGLLQHDNERLFGERTQISKDEGTVVEFNFDGLLLKKKRYPTAFHARRHQTLEPRPFQPSLETTSTNYGIMWQYAGEKMPTTLSFDYNDVSSDQLGRSEQQRRRTNTDVRFRTAYRFNQGNILSLEYSREIHRERPFKLDYDADEVTLDHRWDFGRRTGNRLTSELDWRDQRGANLLRRLRWRETLRLQHTERIRTWYTLELLDRTRGGLLGVPDLEERTLYLSGTLEHRLYESLISQLMGFVQTQEFDSGIEILRYTGLASFDYRKKNRWGLLLGNYSLRFTREDREGAFQAAQRRDVPETFNDPEPITLTTRGIDLGSIVIMTEDRITVYVQDRDYTVHTVGDRVEIRRAPTGEIADGQIVLIDYIFNLGGTFALDTYNQTFGLRQKFSFGLSPYYRLRWQHQKVSPTTAEVIPEDITAHIFGLEFNRGPFSFLAEYETRDSTVIPLDALRFGAGYSRRFKFGAVANIQARWTETAYERPDKRKTKFFTVEGRYRHRITKRLTFEGTALYRNEKDSLARDTEGIDVDLALEWFVRKTQIRVAYEINDFEDDFSKNEASRLVVQVKRKF